MRSLCVSFDPVLSVELVNTSAGCRRLLLAGIERMAFGTNFHVDFFLGRAGYELIAAVAGYFCLVIGRMDTFPHLLHLFTF